MKQSRPRPPSPTESTDHSSNRVRHRLWKIAGFNDPLIIIPYLGFGSAHKLIFGGRVLEDEGLAPANSGDRIWQNLINMYKRFETDEVPGARVRARFQGSEAEVTTDGEGYFRFEIQPGRRLDPNPWQQVELELLHPKPAKQHPVRAEARVLVPSATARFGVISDLDDTVLSSQVENKLKMVLTAIFSNEYTRKPFDGVAGLYRSLQEGLTGAENNPIFYISNSAWNLYTLLVEFLNLQKIPLGPLLLRDFGRHLLFSGEADSHKKKNIQTILDMFPHLPFVLIGDSGERDPEIYRDIVKEHPARIRAIYIRSISQQPARLGAIDKLIEEVQPTGSQLVLVPDSEFAAAHAAAEGLISTAGLAAVRAAKTKDQTAPPQQTR